MNRLLIAAAASLALGGCSTELMRADDASSHAVRSVMAAQAIDLAGVRDSTQVTGIDGRAAGQAQERYEKTFSAPKKAESLDASVLK
ncbi:hypothetical protein [Pseudoduganella sp. GCM10020061]|jgi:hypothetical protein|uniref:hypothetical protein n=1 Tax=Pseudoduganella sp. GCM10020061 TaxID=3317345 RepID=UPI00362B742A